MDRGRFGRMERREEFSDPVFLGFNGRNLVSRDLKAKVKVGIAFVANVLVELTLTYHFGTSNLKGWAPTLI